MTRIPARLRLFAFSLIFLCPVWSAGCGDSPTEPTVLEGVEIGVVVNSIDLSLTLFKVDSPTVVTTVGLGADGSPVGFSIRSGLAAVPMGIAPVLQVVDLQAGSILSSVALPEGSGATGSAWVNDSIVVVANPLRNSVSPVNIRSGQAAPEISVGTYPEAMVVSGGRIFVLNAGLGPDFQPAGPGTITVLDAASLAVSGAIQLTGENPVHGVQGPDGLLYVVNAGRFFGNNGSLSVVDPVGMVEVGHHPGFGDFPSMAAFGPGGDLYVSAFSFGLIVWDPISHIFVRGPENPVSPGGVASVSGVGFDGEGRLYTVLPECQAPGLVHVLDATFTVTNTIQVGTCPFAIDFGVVEE